MNKKAKTWIGIVLVFTILLILFIPLLVSPEGLNQERLIQREGKIKEEINLDGTRITGHGIIGDKKIKERNETPSTEKTVPAYNFNEVDWETAEILDERTELSCNGRSCSWTQTQGKRFHEYENNHYYFNEYITSQESQGALSQESLDNTEVTLTPLVEYNNQEIEITNLSSVIGNQLNYQTTVDQYRDDTKFSINFNTLENLNRIGFKVTSNKDISYRTYNYTPEGVYDEDNFIQYEVTDLIIDELGYSFTDLIESGFEIEYDKENDILWINLEGLEGNIDADPIYSFYSESTDSSLQFVGGSCSGSIYNTTSTFRITDDHQLAPPADMSEQAYLMFNTSSISEDVTLLSASVKVYASLFKSTRRYSPTWNINYYSNESYIGDLDCNDVFYRGEGTSDWGGTTGFKTKFINHTWINTTGYTNYRLLDGWTPSTGQYAYVEVRASEYSGTTYDPLLQVLYETPVGDNESFARQAIEEGIDNSVLTDPEINTDQQIYIRYVNNTHALGGFDKFTTENNQTWVFNYVTSGESYTNIGSLSNIVNVWENSSLAYETIVTQVETFIDSTYI